QLARELHRRKTQLGKASFVESYVEAYLATAFNYKPTLEDLEVQDGLVLLLRDKDSKSYRTILTASKKWVFSVDPIADFYVFVKGKTLKDVKFVGWLPFVEVCESTEIVKDEMCYYGITEPHL